MVEITEKPISPEAVVSRVKTNSSGCVVTYVGLIRQTSRGKEVASVEYRDDGEATQRLQDIVSEIQKRWPLEGVAFCHRIGKLQVGEVNLVLAVASSHREEGFQACQYAIDQFKKKLPTRKRETYYDGSFWVEE
jgi:molybdopterin synthase catalytic subunit